MGFVKKKFTSWSYSRYSDWKNCPLRAKLKHLDKIPEPPSPPMERGIAIAKLGEEYLKGERRNVPKELKPMADDFKKLRKKSDLFVEEMWGFDRQWRVVPWNDWNNCVLRVKIDVGYREKNTVYIVDNKTGKYHENGHSGYDEQLSLYAAAAVYKFEDVEKIFTRLHYTDHGIKYPENPMMVTAEQAFQLSKEWDKKVRPMLNDERFVPNPSNACRWCAYSKARGGPCKY